MMRLTLLILFLLFFTFPNYSFANGGDQRVVEGGKYLVNVSKVPFTPKASERVKMLVSFGDTQKDALISEDLLVNIRIAKLTKSIGDKREFLFKKDGIKVQHGVLEFSYTFQESGLHEVFFDFAFSSDPQKIYSPPDFLMDIQKQSTPVSTISELPTIIVFMLTGFAAGWILRGRKVKS